MKLSCPACFAKYSVADEKVHAALERARCRKCGGSLALADEGSAEGLRVEADLASQGGGEAISVAPRSEGTEIDDRRARRKQRDMFSPPALAEVSREPKLTGQRNDTSVLFSLGALSKEAAELERTPVRGQAEGDGSGLIDIRALSAAHGTKSAIPMPTVDDLVNLGGSGLGGSPLLAAPPPEPSPSPVASREGKRGVWIALAGGALFFLGAVVLAVVATRSVSPPPRTPVVERDAPAPVPTIAEAHPQPTMPPVVVAPTPEPEGPKGTSEPAKNKPIVTPKGTPEPHAPPPVTATATATVAPTPAPPTPSSGSLAPFNRGEAAAALASIAYTTCKKADGPTGQGHVTVVFSPSGSVESVMVDQGSFVGTPVGGCIAGKFRAAKISAFSGGTMRVGKSISL